MSKLKQALLDLSNELEYNEEWLQHFEDQDPIHVMFNPENVFPEFRDPNDLNKTSDEEGLKTVNGHEIYLGWMGGDWESAVHLIYYLDKHDVLRMYVPKEGNMYNFDTNQAIGNAEEGDYDFDKDVYTSLSDDEKFLQGQNCPSWIDGTGYPMEGEINHINIKISVDLMIAEFFKEKAGEL